MSDLIQCVYTSVASASFVESDLPDLLRKARIANEAAGVTGMLAYCNGNFLQVLEGPESAVDALISKISKDRRHKRVFVIAREAIETRNFATWSMGYAALLPAEAENLIGENDFFDAGSCLDTLDDGIVKTVLQSFRRMQAESLGL